MRHPPRSIADSVGIVARTLVELGAALCCVDAAIDSVARGVIDFYTIWHVHDEGAGVLPGSA